jgi:hypothetical protein
MAHREVPGAGRDSGQQLGGTACRGRGRGFLDQSRMSKPEAESAPHELQAVLELQGLPAPWELRTTRGWRVEASGWSGLAGPLHPGRSGERMEGVPEETEG